MKSNNRINNLLAKFDTELLEILSGDLIALQANSRKFEARTVNFDKELMAILSHDLNNFKLNRGQFLQNSTNLDQTIAPNKMVA